MTIYSQNGHKNTQITDTNKNKSPKNQPSSTKVKKATPGFEPGVKALQASALPLGQVAL